MQAAARRLGVRAECLQSAAGFLQSGVPHVVPAAIARPFAETWLEAIDAFDGRGYVDSMYAFGLAAAALELEVVCTQHMITNFDHDRSASDADMIHYGYGDARWDKRCYLRGDQIDRVWSPSIEADDGTVLGAIVQQLREARDWYEQR